MTSYIYFLLALLLYYDRLGISQSLDENNFWMVIRTFMDQQLSLYEIFLKILTLCVNVLSIYRERTRWWIEIRIHSQNGFNPLCIVSLVWRRWLAMALFFFAFLSKKATGDCFWIRCKLLEQSLFNKTDEILH